MAAPEPRQGRRRSWRRPLLAALLQRLLHRLAGQAALHVVEVAPQLRLQRAASLSSRRTWATRASSVPSCSVSVSRKAFSEAFDSRGRPPSAGASTGCCSMAVMTGSENPSERMRSTRASLSRSACSYRR
jgi:hypothetical protein